MRAESGSKFSGSATDVIQSPVLKDVARRLSRNNNGLWLWVQRSPGRFVDKLRQQKSPIFRSGF
jgi:hypothetical protein